MALEQLDMISGMTKSETALELIRACEPPEGYYLADSGGKDSTVIRDLAIRAGVKFDSHYCISPIDPPEVRAFLKEHHPDTQWDNHVKGFWKLVVKKQLPMRMQRWCCKYIKEAGGEGRTVIVGTRRAESTNRKRQRCFEEIDGKIYLRPINLWSEKEVWQYIHENALPYCSLYDEGFKRIGCVLCPSNTNTKLHIERFPKIVYLWRRACDRIIEDRHAHGTWLNFSSGEELFQWWIEKHK